MNRTWCLIIRRYFATLICKSKSYQPAESNLEAQAPWFNNKQHISKHRKTKRNLPAHTRPLAHNQHRPPRQYHSQVGEPSPVSVFLSSALAYLVLYRQRTNPRPQNHPRRLHRPRQHRLLRRRDRRLQRRLHTSALVVINLLRRPPREANCPGCRVRVHRVCRSRPFSVAHPELPRDASLFTESAMRFPFESADRRDFAESGRATPFAE